MEEELNDVREKRAENKNREIGLTLQGPTRIQFRRRRIGGRKWVERGELDNETKESQ